MNSPVEQCGRREDQVGEDEEVFWTNNQGQQESSCKVNRCVCHLGEDEGEQ